MATFHRKDSQEKFIRQSNVWWYTFHKEWSYYDSRLQAIHGEGIWNDTLRSHDFLGLEVKQCSDGILISQAKYALDVLKKFAMEDCDPADNPVEYGTRLTKEGEGDLVNPTYYKNIVGCLRYLTCTRPDILFGVGLVSRYMERPRSSHLKAAKRILRFIKGTLNYGLCYSSS